MEDNFYVVTLLCFLVILKHYLRRRFDIETSQDDRNPCTSQVNTQQDAVEGCKSLHFNTPCAVRNALFNKSNK